MGANQLQVRISNVEDRIKHHQKHIEKTKHQLNDFEVKANDELAELGEELERAEKARSSAQLLHSAAHRNLDNFTASLKAIEGDIAGGAEPRQRIVEAKPLHGRRNARSVNQYRTDSHGPAVNISPRASPTKLRPRSM